MKKLILLLGCFIFFTNLKTVQAEETCVPDNKPTIDNTDDFYYVIGDELPDYLEGVTSTNSCGVEVSMTYNDEDVNYEVEGSYSVYYYSLGTAVTVNVNVYDSIPDLDGLHDFTVEIFDESVDFLAGVTATNVFNNIDITNDIIIDKSNIDFTNVGEYELIYIISDGTRNARRTVNVSVIDPTAPQINNCVDLTLEVHQNLNQFDFWENVEVFDNSGKKVTKSIDFRNLDIHTVDKYDIDYIASDESGNETHKVITVHVVDTTAPSFNNLSDRNILLGTELSEALFKQGVSLTDNYDQLLTMNYIIVDFHLVDITKPGNYPVMFIGFDSSGNQRIKNINVRIYDEDTPVIGNVSDLQVPLNSSSIDYLDGVTCVDETDGNIIDQVIVNHQLVNLNKTGKYPVTYTVIDSSGNYASKTAYIIIYDEAVPVINGLSEYSVEIYSDLTETYFLNGLTVTDDNDGDLTGSLNVNISQIDFTKLGSYTITYTVSDSSDNTTEETINVNVVDSTPPEISNVNEITISLDEEIDILARLANVEVIDNYDGDLSENIEIKGFYDSSKVGTYPLRIVVSDSNGNEGEVTFDLVVVNENSISSGGFNFNIYYIIGGMGIALALLGFIGYKTRRVK